MHWKDGKKEEGKIFIGFQQGELDLQKPFVILTHWTSYYTSYVKQVIPYA